MVIDDHRSMSPLYSAAIPVVRDASAMAASTSAQCCSPPADGAVSTMPKSRSRVGRTEPRSKASAPPVSMILTRHGTRAANSAKKASRAAGLRFSIGECDQRELVEVLVGSPYQELQERASVAILDARPPIRTVPAQMRDPLVPRRLRRREPVDHQRGDVIGDRILRLSQTALAADDGACD